MTGTTDFDIGYSSDQGIQRKDNQDRVARADEAHGIQHQQRERYGRLYVVADGVGGNRDGGDAADMVVKGVIQHYYAEQTGQRDDLHERLQRAIQQTSREIYEEGERRRNDMASTVVAALIHNDRLIVANVGDSRALLIRSNKPVEQLSTDHAIPGRKGELTQSMGDAEVHVAMREVSFNPNDAVVLCTDGLTDLAEPQEIQQVVSGNNATSATRDLISLANGRGGHDNITALVVRYGNLPLWAQKSVRRFAMIASVLLTVLGLFFFLIIPGILADEGGVPVSGETKTGDFMRDSNTTDVSPTSELLSTSTSTPTLPSIPTSTLVPTSPRRTTDTTAPITKTTRPDEQSIDTSPAETADPVKTNSSNREGSKASFTTPTPNPPSTLVIPNVVGLDTESAEAEIKNAGFVPAQRYDGTHCTPFHVTRQNPAAGEPLAPGATVTITICPQVIVPDVLGQDKAVAN